MSMTLLGVGGGNGGNPPTPYANAPVRLFGFNLNTRNVPSGVAGQWRDLYYDLINNTPADENGYARNWSQWMKPQIDKCKALGANCVRLIGAGGTGFYADPPMYTQEQYLDAVRRIIRYVRQNGMYFYGVALAQDSMKGVAPDDPLTTEQMVDEAVAYVEMLTEFDNVICCDLIQESDLGLYSDANALLLRTDVYVACRAVAPDMRFTFSGVAGTSDRVQLVDHSDLFDEHQNDTATTATSMSVAAPWTLGYPSIMGEHGEGVDAGQAAQETHYTNKMQHWVIDENCQGALPWSGPDNDDLIATGQYGVFTNDSIASPGFNARTYITDILDASAYTTAQDLIGPPRTQTRNANFGGKRCWVNESSETLLLGLNWWGDDTTTVADFLSGETFDAVKGVKQPAAPTIVGTWSLSNLRATCTALDSGAASLTWSDIGGTDFTARVILRCAGTDRPYIVFRRTDADSYWMVRITMGGAMDLIENNNGVVTTRSTMTPIDSGFVAGNDYLVIIRVKGANVTVTADGGGQTVSGQNPSHATVGYIMTTSLAGTGFQVFLDTAAGLSLSTVEIRTTVDDVVFYDRFVGTNGTAISSHTPEPIANSMTWSYAQGTGQISSNRIQQTSATGTNLQPLVDPGTDDIEARFTFQWRNNINTNALFGVIGRYVDANNSVRAELIYFGGAPKFYLYEYVSGAAVPARTVERLVKLSHQWYYTLRLICNGTTVTAYFGNEPIATIENCVLTGTKFGLNMNTSNQVGREFQLVALGA